MGSSSIASLVPELQPFAREIIDIAGANRLQPRITSARRSHSEQKRLYDRYLRGLQPYPVAAPGTSAHETGEAFDFVTTPVEYLADLGGLWKSWGGEWGGNADPVHFQLPGAPSAERLRTLKAQAKSPSLYEYLVAASGFTSFVSALLELGIIASSEKEAIRIARLLHIDPYGRVF